jgi:hypothetical protein
MGMHIDNPYGDGLPIHQQRYHKHQANLAYLQGIQGIFYYLSFRNHKS